MDLDGKNYIVLPPDHQRYQKDSSRLGLPVGLGKGRVIIYVHAVESELRLPEHLGVMLT